MIRVGVSGALGRMGRVACAAIAAADDLALSAGLDRDHAGDLLAARVDLGASAAAEGARLFSDPVAFAAAGLDVILDMSLYPFSLKVAHAAVAAGVAPVVGTSGWTEADATAFGAECARLHVPALLIPNFAIGAALMMRFSVLAAPYFPSVEIVELHHDRKLDKPSGTAAATARSIVKQSHHDDVPIHSVRLRGLVAHQEVIFGGEGETLTLRHDSLSRDSFVVGMLLCIRRVRDFAGLVVGLDNVLEQERQRAHA